jgi:hypothetical protein
MPSGIGDVALGAAGSVGRYFVVVSVLPSSLLVSYSYILIRSGAAQSRVDWAAGFHALAHAGVGGALLLGFIAVGVALLTHPLQFAIVQAFEGYWGTNRIAQALRVQRILRHQKRAERLEELEANAAEAMQELATKPEAVEERTRPESWSDEAQRERLTLYPRALDHVMPTRLGNVMRRFESAAGTQYGLDAPTIFPHLMLVAPAEHVAYVNDQRSQLDLAVRMAFTALLATAVSVGCLWRDGLWLLIAAIPYAAAYLSYRGSVVLARQYATAVTTVIDLDRFLLYERLHLDVPATTRSERSQNRRMLRLLQHTRAPTLTYFNPQPQAGQPSEPAVSGD